MYQCGRGTRCFQIVDVGYLNAQDSSNPEDRWRLDSQHELGDVHTNHHLHLFSHNTKHIHTRYRLVLAILGRHIIHFQSTHDLSQYMLGALKAHFCATTIAGIECPEISANTIIAIHQSDDTANTSLLIDWDLSEFSNGPEPRQYERIGTPRQFMAARLCGEDVQVPTLGDELESFVLLLLWIAAKYAPSDMLLYDRAGFLKHFDHDEFGKTNLYSGAEHTVTRLRLVSGSFEGLLIDILNVYRWRYKFLAQRNQQADALEELKKKQELLESHKWLMATISNALDNEDWIMDTLDPCRFGALSC